MAREAIALMLDVGELDIDVKPPARVVDLLEALRRSEVQVEEARETLAETRRRAAEELRAEIGSVGSGAMCSSFAVIGRSGTDRGTQGSSMRLDP